jgi:hypothetical protein
MLIKNYTSSRYLHPLIYIIQIQPPTTNYLPIRNSTKKTPFKKKYGWSEKKSYANFAYRHQANGKGCSLPIYRRIKLASPKRTKVFMLKFGLNGPIVVNSKKFNNTMSAMG